MCVCMCVCVCRHDVFSEAYTALRELVDEKIRSQLHGHPLGGLLRWVDDKGHVRFVCRAHFDDAMAAVDETGEGEAA